MLKYILILLFSSSAFAGPPVIWDPVCASGIFNLPLQACLAGGTGGVSSVTASGPLASSGGANPDISITGSDFTAAGTDGIAITGGTGAVLSTASIAQHVADATHNGYLSSVDWSTFNNTSTAVATSAANQLYVDGTIGNDLNNCQILFPCQTINAALTIALATVTPTNTFAITVNFGSYLEDLSITKGGIFIECESIEKPPESGVQGCLLNGNVVVNLNSSNKKFFQMSGFTVTNQVLNGAAFYLTGANGGKVNLSSVVISSQAIDGNGILIDSSDRYDLNLYDVNISNNSATFPTIDNESDSNMTISGITSQIANASATGKSIRVNSPNGSLFFPFLTNFAGTIDLAANAQAIMYFSTINAGGTTSAVTIGASSLLASFSQFFTANGTYIVSGTGTYVGAGTSVCVGSTCSLDPALGSFDLPTVVQIASTFTKISAGATATTAVNSVLVTSDGHTKSEQTTDPTALVNANAGAGATCTLTDPTDVAGKINLTTTATTPASGVQCEITFNKSYNTAPICVTSPNSADAATQAVASGVFFTTSTTKLTVNFANTDVAGHAYNWMYNCMETQ